MALVCMASAASADQHDRSQAAVVLDEDVWVTFYDLPSRRFRAIRTSILNRNYEAAARDLRVTANYVSVEAERAAEVFQAPLREVAERLREFSDGVEDITLEELGSLFGRTHWLLAQHYLQLGRHARDARQNRNAGLYLWATTHHMERAILWSNVPVTREVRRTLDNLRSAATQLQDSETSARAYREKPVVRAERLLRQVGEQIDRRVLLPAAQEPGDAPDKVRTEPEE